jgi:hypothetical protein
MKIYISDADKQSARGIALKNIARFYKLSDWEFKSNEELLKEVSELKDESAIEIYGLLIKYFSAYDEWFAFYQQKMKIEKNTGKEYNLNNTENIELVKLINNRESELDALQKKFDELQRSVLVLNH